MHQSDATKSMNVIELTGMSVLCDFVNAAQMSKYCFSQ